MTRKHLFFGAPIKAIASELDTLANFDDRTLATLIGSGHRPLDDGNDNDAPYRVLPLERWRDRD